MFTNLCRSLIGFFYKSNCQTALNFSKYFSGKYHLQLAPVVVVDVRPSFVLTSPAGGPLLRILGLPLRKLRLALIKLRLALRVVRLPLSEFLLLTISEVRLTLWEILLTISVCRLSHWVRSALHRRLAVRTRPEAHDAPTHPLGQVGGLQSLRARPKTQSRTF